MIWGDVVCMGVRTCKLRTQPKTLAVQYQVYLDTSLPILSFQARLSCVVPD
jgi:hypothetical protein